MGASSASPSAAVGVIAAMITPALLILGSTSLVASALMRMARIVDRARVLAAVALGGNYAEFGLTPTLLRDGLARHALRARQAERSIALFYSAIVVFIATCLSIAVSRLAGEAAAWISVMLAIVGTLLMLSGGAWMVVETQSSAQQIQQEISHALTKLESIQP